MKDREDGGEADVSGVKKGMWCEIDGFFHHLNRNI